MHLDTLKSWLPYQLQIIGCSSKQMVWNSRIFTEYDTDAITEKNERNEDVLDEKPTYPVQATPAAENGVLQDQTDAIGELFSIINFLESLKTNLVAIFNYDVLPINFKLVSLLIRSYIVRGNQV